MKLITILLLSVPLLGLTQKNHDNNSIDQGQVIFPESRNIQFELGSFIIQEASFETLDSLYILLTKKPSINIEVGVHLDQRIPAKMSTRLDQRRAEEIVKYLVNKGIEANRLIAIGYGSTRPLVSQDSIDKMKSEQAKEQAYALNRRVEIKVIELKK